MNGELGDLPFTYVMATREDPKLHVVLFAELENGLPPSDKPSVGPSR